MSSNGDEDISYGAGDEGWADDEDEPLTRDGHEGVGPDPNEQTSSNSQATNGSSQASDSDDEPSDSDGGEGSQAGVTPTSEMRYDWETLVNHPAYAAHAQGIAEDFDHPEVDLIPVSTTQLKPFKDSKGSVQDNTDGVNMRVRPEVAKALEQFQQVANEYFEDDHKVYKTFAYEAILVAGLHNLDFAMGVLGAYGYGLETEE